MTLPINWNDWALYRKTHLHFKTFHTFWKNSLVVAARDIAASINKDDWTTLGKYCIKAYGKPHSVSGLVYQVHRLE